MSRDRIIFYDKVVLSSGVAALLIAGVLSVYALRQTPASAASHGSGTVATASTYRPQAKTFTVTIVPMLVHEQSGFFDYLKGDFAKGGLLADKEVWGFSPSTLVAYQGDRITLDIFNPGDDPHTFTAMDLGVNANLPPRSVKKISFVVNKAGAFNFMCAVAEHDPFMWGTFVVLPDSAA